MHSHCKRNLPNLVGGEAFLLGTAVALVAVLVAGVAWLERLVNEVREI